MKYPTSDFYIIEKLGEIDTNLRKLIGVMETLIDANQLVGTGVKSIADSMLEIHKMTVEFIDSRKDSNA